MSQFLKTLCVCALLLLAGCGFRPVYGVYSQTDETIESSLADVGITLIPDREGQYLRNALIDRFYRNGEPVNPQYILNVRSLNESLAKLDITKDSDSTRGQLKISTNFTLIDTHTGETVLTRSIRSIASYNLLASEFATRVSEDSTRLNALDDLARQIEQQVSLYLKRQ